MHVIRGTLSALLVTSVIGCGQDAAPVGTVAIVDLDAVAKGLGEDVELRKAIAAKRRELATKLTTLQRQLDREFKEKKDKFGEEPTDEQTEELQTLRREQSAIINNAQLEAEYSITEHNQRLISRYRAKAKPAAERVAAHKGFTIVMMKNDNLLLTFDDAADITDDVVTELLKEDDKPQTQTNRDY